MISFLSDDSLIIIIYLSNFLGGYNIMQRVKWMMAAEFIFMHTECLVCCFKFISSRCNGDAIMMMMSQEKMQNFIIKLKTIMQNGFVR